jgi:hypothetical protein
MTNNPEQIKADIEATRAELSQDVDALAETVRPANVARRQKNKARSAVFGAKDKARSAVFGAKDTIMGGASQVQSASGEALQSTGEAISSAPQVVRQRAEGNPMAVGLIALGVGWLAGSLLPATRVERQAADALKERMAPLAQEVSDMTKESVQNLQEPAKEALAEVKSTGSGALHAVKEEGGSAAADIADTAKEGAQNIKESSQSG